MFILKEVDSVIDLMHNKSEWYFISFECNLSYEGKQFVKSKIWGINLIK
jgi:hypothetical protein